MDRFISDIKEHLGHYFVLLFILAVGYLAFFYFQRFPQAQVISIFLTTSFYVLWGIIHHYLEGDLHLRIILEYVAVALLGFLMLLTIINRV